MALVLARRINEQVFIDDHLMTVVSITPRSATITVDGGSYEIDMNDSPIEIMPNVYVKRIKGANNPHTVATFAFMAPKNIRIFRKELIDKHLSYSA